MIEITDLHKSFGDNKVLRGTNLVIETGETIVIIGRSGCGKSVLIKHIVGLLMPDSGTVKVEGQIVNEMNLGELYELRKRFGFLFQGAALFDSMTVEENISLSLVESENSYSIFEISKLVEEKLEMVNLPGTRKVTRFDCLEGFDQEFLCRIRDREGSGVDHHNAANEFGVSGGELERSDSPHRMTDNHRPVEP